jgi:hypothetical protein
MKINRGERLGLGVGALVLALASCRHDCLLLPCPMPLALRVRVTDAATHGPVPGATLQVSGATNTGMPCEAQCYVPGTAGTYVLDVSAPGFQSQRLTVAVQGTNPECGCPTTMTQDLEIALSPIP